MYSQLPYALAELVANAYDAGADNVLIKLYDNDPNNKRIVIIDDGDGMSYDEVGEKFLVIGRKRRDTDEERINSKGRRITEKRRWQVGIICLGKTIKIETTCFGETKRTSFLIIFPF